MILFFYIFLGFTLINCGFYVYLTRFAWSKDHFSTKKADFPISIVVCAKDEAENLSIIIPKLLDQVYPEFEIVLINDNSTDSTWVVMQDFAKKDSRITLLNIDQAATHIAGKKFALSKGIKKAKYNHLLFTDADCVPVSKQWIQKMANGFERNNDNTQIVLGYGGYKKIRGSFLNKIIRYETVLTALTYFGFAKNKNAYMGVGRNLAYTKALFADQNGFDSHLDIPSGDDDLFISKAATKTNTTSIYSADSFTLSISKKNWGEWLHQKRRHTSTASHYKMKHKSALALFYLSELLFFTCSIGLFIIPQDYLVPVALIFMLRLIFVWSIVGAAMKKLNEKELIVWFPLLEFLLILSQLTIFITSFIYRPEPWKKNLI